MPFLQRSQAKEVSENSKGECCAAIHQDDAAADVSQTVLVRILQ